MVAGGPDLVRGPLFILILCHKYRYVLIVLYTADNNNNNNIISCNAHTTHTQTNNIYYAHDDNITNKGGADSGAGIYLSGALSNIYY